MNVSEQSIAPKCYPGPGYKRLNMAFSCQIALSSGRLHVRTLRDVTQLVQSTGRHRKQENKTSIQLGSLKSLEVDLMVS